MYLHATDVKVDEDDNPNGAVIDIPKSLAHACALWQRVTAVII